jgi:hypothetical protein
MKGYGLYHTSKHNINLNNADLIVKIEDGKIERVDKHALSKYIIRFYRDLPPKLFEGKNPLALKMYKDKPTSGTYSLDDVMDRLSKNNLISEGLLQMLKDFDDENPQQFNDDRDNVYIPFNNKIVHINKDKIDTMEWNEAEGVVWKDNIQDWNIKLLNNQKAGNFEFFLRKACYKRKEGKQNTNDWKKNRS